MGNWRRVHLIGTCDRVEVAALRSHLRYDFRFADPDKPFTCLSYSSPPALCGLGEWPDTKMDRIGNLAERDYTPEDVAATLAELLKLTPSLDVRVHCGADWEEDECIATVVAAGGSVEVRKPEIETVPKIPDGQAEANLYRNLLR